MVPNRNVALVWVAAIVLGVAIASCGSDSTSGSGGASSSSASVASSGAGASGGTCDPTCGPGLVCCGTSCVNAANDVTNCGACGVVCQGPNPFCAGTCQQAPCEADAGACGTGACCGSSCCAAGELCCDVNMGGPSVGPKCYPPANGTCPVGCPGCD